MDVIKSTGEKEKFSAQKLCGSIVEAGAPDDLAENVCALVQQKLSPEVTTNEIFRTASRYLLKEDLHITARYSLRRGMSSLGPAGFIFEQYIETLLQAYGYQTERNIMMRGRCVEHEVDILAKKDGRTYIIEAKYKNDTGVKTHIDDVMYADARFIDIVQQFEADGQDPRSLEIWLVTNTKFTGKSIAYGKCRRMKLVGWRYPNRHESLESMIIEKKLYPITVLPSVSREELRAFAKSNMMLAQDVLPFNPTDLTAQFGIPPEIAQKIVDEAVRLTR